MFKYKGRVNELEYKVRELDGKIGCIDEELEEVKQDFLKSHNTIKKKLDEGFDKRERISGEYQERISSRIEGLRDEQHRVINDFNILKTELESIKRNTEDISNKFGEKESGTMKVLIGFVISIILMLLGVYVI